MNQRWTDESDAIMKRLRGDGLSASAIAVQLGLDVTRNMVIGRLHRLDAKEGRSKGLKEVRGRVEKRAATAKAAPGKSALGRPRTGYVDRPSRNRPPPSSPPLSAPPTAIRALPVVVRPSPSPPTGPVRFLPRLSSQCCWPTGGGSGPDLVCCGLPVVGSLTRAWCAGHWEAGTGRGTPSERAADREAA